MSNVTIYTVGHSTHEFAEFLRLLDVAGIDAIADVRSAPWSKHLPHFNRDALKASLRQEHIAYRFFGKMLGGRPDDPSLFSGIIADYEAMAKTEYFAEGISRVVSGAKKHRLAMMCSEHDPMDCHRCLLVGRALAHNGVTVKHILTTGELRTQRDIEAELLRTSGGSSADFFLSPEDQLAQAYRERARRVAFRDRSEEQYAQEDFTGVQYS